MSHRRLEPAPIWERLADEFSGMLRHRHYHDQQGTQSPPTTAFPAITAATEAPVSTILSDIHTAVTEGITNIKGWAGDLETELPKLAALAAKYESSPIVKELEALGEVALPPEVEASIVGLIQMGGKIVAGAAGAVAPPAAEVPAAPAEPAAPVA
jgi:hypothetical protein